MPIIENSEFENKVVVITGAGNGLGRSHAIEYAKRGAKVVVNDLGGSVDGSGAGDAADQVVAELQAMGAEAVANKASVSDPDGAQSIIQSALDAFGRIDILVNNAGTNRPGPMHEMTLGDFDAVMNLNVRAAYFVAKAVVKKMQLKGQGGSIINTSSQMGHVGGIDRTIYSASKHAIEGLTRALAIELGKDNIRVNTICPTFIRTPMTEKTFANPALVEWIQSKIKLGRIGEIEDVMGAFVFLASDAAAMMTGSSLMIDGGWTAG